MASPDMPVNETERLAALHRYRILDTPPEPAFDRITALAARLFDVPIALVVLVDESRTWIKSHHGLPVSWVGRALSFCSYSILGDQVFTIEDTLKDERFTGNPLVTGEPHVRSYAGAPLCTAAGLNLGTLALLDRRPRCFEQRERDLLAALARVVVDELELRLEADASRLALEDSDPRLRMFSEHLPVAMWTTDRELRFTSGVGAAIDALERDGDSARDLRVYEYFGPGEPGAQIAAVHRRALAGEDVAYEVEWAGRVFHAHVAPLRDAGGAVVGVIGVALDATAHVVAERERDAARGQLARAERLAALGTLAASVGHEIANPLSYVLASSRAASLALRRIARASAAADDLAAHLGQARAALADIEVGAGRIEHIVRDLRLFGRTEAGERGRTDDPARVVASAVRIATPEIRQVAELEVDLAAVGPIDIHETQLAQVSLNLLINAAQSIDAEARGRIRVALREATGAVELTVSDTGSGIPAELVPRIFEPFFTTKPAEVGTGLGLSVVRDILQRAGGTIAVDTALGRGTTFTVRLPRAPSPPPAR